MIWLWIGISIGVLIVLYDVTQRQKAILRNFPIIGHFRYLLEMVGPELRQYIVTNNDEERPFSRDQRRWIYASAKLQNNYFGFGTDNDLESSKQTLIIKPAVFTYSATMKPAADPNDLHLLPCAKILGKHHNRAKAFRPESVVNVSGMSFGALSGNAVAALNEGCRLTHCLHNTGEGGISSAHNKGGALVWQIGTGYFGCRTQDGKFSREKFLETVQKYPVRAIEIKLSQGAKPGLGGVLPAKKVSVEIAAARGVTVGQSCISPPRHSAFHDVDSLIDFVEDLAAATGLPVGIKCAVGELEFWENLAVRMVLREAGPDFITIDGGEGGTGAAPLAFTDHVSLPFKIGFSRVRRIFQEHGLHRELVFIGSGRLGFPEQVLAALSMGCDMVNIAREAMMSIGCIQAQRCHTNHCPTGVATQNRWLARGLDPDLKSVRFANYMITLRHEVTRLSHACGVPHPAFVRSDQVELVDERFGGRTLSAVFDLDPMGSLPHARDLEALCREFGYECPPAAMQF